jgi:hypothetical protein
MCILFRATKQQLLYKTKVVKNWEHISVIYSKNDANGEGAKIGVDSREEIAEPKELSSELAQKRQRTGEPILRMLGDMKTTFQYAFKSTDPIPLPKATLPKSLAYFS